METLHLDVSLVYTSPHSVPSNTVQHMTSLSHHKTSVQLDISQAPKPGRPAASPPPACIRAGFYSILITRLCICLLASPAYEGPAQCSSVLLSEGHENHKCKFIKMKKKQFFFSIFIFNCLLLQSLSALHQCQVYHLPQYFFQKKLCKDISLLSRNVCSQRQETASALISPNILLIPTDWDLKQRLNGSTFLESFSESWL